LNEFARLGSENARDCPTTGDNMVSFLIDPREAGPHYFATAARKKHLTRKIKIRLPNQC